MPRGCGLPLRVAARAAEDGRRKTAARVGGAGRGMDEGGGRTYCGRGKCVRQQFLRRGNSDSGEKMAENRDDIKRWRGRGDSDGGWEEVAGIVEKL